MKFEYLTKRFVTAYVETLDAAGRSRNDPVNYADIFQADAQALGALGWELVAVLPAHGHVGIDAYFKREIP